jgi:hypothetical protein
MEKIYVVKYTGTFGFIKPHSAVRDAETYSQQFLTESIIIGMQDRIFGPGDKKQNLSINQICRNKVFHQGLSSQQETIKAPEIKFSRSKDTKALYSDSFSIIKRHVMIRPELYLGFNNEEDAKEAMYFMLRLSRNEDLMTPMDITDMSEEEFDKIKGIEYVPSKEGLFVGANRFNNFSPMYGELKINL